MLARAAPASRRALVTASLAGALAGLAGAGVMTAGEKLEQAFTGRPNSYVPGRTIAHLLRLRRPDKNRTGRNWLMHYGTGASVGMIRGVMAAAGLRGPQTAALFTPVRLSVDQTLENLTGVGSPPWTWPPGELALDVGHKAVYALATGAFADALTPRSHPPTRMGRLRQRLRRR